MALLYAKPAEYAIRALTYLARNTSPEPVTVHDIADAEGISSHHLSKVMKTLSHHKLVQSLRGPGGGFVLVADPHAITLWDVLGCLEVQHHLEECALGGAPCHDDDPCPLHERWVPIREQIHAYLRRVTISELADTAAKKAQIPPSNSAFQISLPQMEA